MNKENLVICRKTFTTERGVEFKAGSFYRHCPYECGDSLIYGELFTASQAKEHFINAIDFVVGEWADLNMVKHDGSPLSKTAFKKRAYDGHQQLGNQRHGIHGFHMGKHPKELSYTFVSHYRDNKSQTLDIAYGNYLSILNGDPSSLDDKEVQRGNSGIPLSGSQINIRWKLDVVEPQFFGDIEIF